jgi:hypothetical protein
MALGSGVGFYIVQPLRYWHRCEVDFSDFLYAVLG